uniref:Uncharacterized protein n=1 Tax=Anopheles christyi TaxID=43041 RepID=A0A182KD41_9DIPT
MLCYQKVILGPPALQQAVRFSEGLVWNNRPIYNYCMRGVITCFTGIRKKNELGLNEDLNEPAITLFIIEFTFAENRPPTDSTSAYFILLLLLRPVDVSTDILFCFKNVLNR